MALKEKALRRLAEKLDAKGIPFAAGGDWMRCVRGQAETWHEFDIYVRPGDGERAAQVLGRLGMPAGENAWHFDGAEVRLHPDAPEDFQAGAADVLGAQVRLLKEEP